MSFSRRTRSLASPQSCAPVKNHATPEGTTSSLPVSRSNSRQRSSARRAERVYQSLSPCAKRIRRDSPPEAARTCPGGYCSTSVTSQPLETSLRASDPPKMPAPTTTALRKRDRLRAAGAEPPRRELAGVGAQDQPGPRRPEPGALEVGARRPRRRARVRVEDRELVALVLEEPDLGLDLEPEPVWRRVGVAAALVADGVTVAQEDETARLVRRLLERVLFQLAPDLSGDQHRTRRSRRIR